MKYLKWPLLSIFLHASLLAALLYSAQSNFLELPEQIHFSLEDSPNKPGSALSSPSSFSRKETKPPQHSPSKPEPHFDKPLDSHLNSGDDTSAAGEQKSESYGGSDSFSGVTKYPKVRSEFKAVYPAEAKQARIDGSVVLDVFIDQFGQVRNVILIHGPGYGLNESAMEALKKFEFSPAYKGKEPVAVKIRYNYKFKLDVN